MSNFDPRTIAQIMGGKVTGRNRVSVPGPGHSPKDDSLSILIDARAPGGFVVYSHANDDPLLCRDYVRQRLGLETWSARSNANFSIPPLSVTVSSDKDEANRKAFAQKIWQQSTDPTGTIVERYLLESRGLQLSSQIVNSVVRYHARLRLGDQTFPGMVRLMRNVKTDDPCGIQRTFLDTDGKKIERRTLGIAKNAAIKIDSHESINGPLTIGEGFETTYASKLAGFGPSWALGSAGAIKTFPVITRVKALTILQENDETGTSARAVAECGKRYLAAKRPVNVVTPRADLADFNDVWLEARK
nr:virulence-associated protein E [Afipia sp.]